MGVRDALRKAAGLIVELPQEEEENPPNILAEVQPTANQSDTMRQAKSQVDPVNDALVLNLDEITAFGPAILSASTPDGKVDFAIIYKQAKLSATPFTAEQMLEMLAELPAGLPTETKQQFVRVSLKEFGKTIGATPETVIADASNKLSTLERFVEAVAKQISQNIASAEKGISDLQAEISRKRKQIEIAQQEQEKLTRMCRAECERLDSVLKFFGADRSTGDNTA